MLPRYLQRKFLEYLVEKYGLADIRIHNRDEVLCALSARIQKREEMSRIETILQELTEACYSGNPPGERDASHLFDEVSRFVEGKRVLGRPA